MSREKHEREDLLAEATALIERAEISLPAAGATLVVGFHRLGCLSIYFDGDPVYHWNTRGELRRAFVDDSIVKAERGRLASLRRTPSDDASARGEASLVRHDLTPDETEEFLARLGRRLQTLLDALASGDFEVLRQVPVEADVVGRLVAVLTKLPTPPSIAASPRAC